MNERYAAYVNLSVNRDVFSNGQVTEDNDDQNEADENQEEAVVVDADSSDGAVLVNGHEAEEQWGTNNDVTPSAYRHLVWPV